MAALLAGLALLALLLVLARGYTGSNPKQLLKGFRFSGGIVLVLLTIAFILLDRFPFALLTAGGAWVLLLGTTPPWHRPDFGAGGTGVKFPVDRLSDRELEVFRLIGQGHGTRRIAEELHLSVKTVESYR